MSVSFEEKKKGKKKNGNNNGQKNYQLRHFNRDPLIKFLFMYSFFFLFISYTVEEKTIEVK